MHQRIGWAKEKHPSVQNYYDITLSSKSKTGLETGISWKNDTDKDQEKTESFGIYFLQTNLNEREEIVVWNIYNTIREIENAFRTLKTDLDLRPIYQNNVDATIIYLHLGLMGYWLVNILKYQLKQIGIKSCWDEIVRIGNTQKEIISSGTKTYDKMVTAQRVKHPTTT